MRVSDKLRLYFFSLAAAAGFSAVSFVEYDKRHKAILLASCIFFGVVFLVIVVNLFRWWRSKVYNAAK